MAIQLIGDTTWTRIPGEKEVNGDDGSITVTRFYNGAITGGSGGSGETSWAAFKASHPLGTSDPVYGTSVRSTSLPTITSAGNGIYKASITFRGGDFDTNGETAPTVTVSKVSRVIEVVHPGGSISWETFPLTYNAWQTVVSYVRTGPPATSGSKSGYASSATITIDSDEIQQGPLPTGADAPMTDAQLVAALAQGSTILTDLSYTRRSGEDGNVIYDVWETWTKQLELAP